MAKQPGRQKRRRIWVAVAVLVVLFAAAAAWKWTPLAEQIEMRKVAAWAASLRSNPARTPIILAAYVVGSLILVPITVLIIGTALVYGVLWGSVYALIGCLLGAIVTYAVGYFLGKDFVRKLIGPKLNKVERKIAQSGIIAVTVLRLLPVAPFTIVNIVCGAFKVPIRAYIAGSILGLIPGILVINFFAYQLQNAIRNPGLGTFIALGVMIVLTIWGTVWLRRKLAV